METQSILEYLERQEEEKIKINSTPYYNNELYNSSCHGNLANIKLFYSYGATNLSSSLEAACFHGHIEIIKFLFSKGVELTYQSFTNACINGNLEIVKLLACSSIKYLNPGISLACATNNLSLVELLISLGATEYEYEYCADYTIGLLMENKRNKGGYEDKLLSLGVNKDVITYKK